MARIKVGPSDNLVLVCRIIDGNDGPEYFCKAQFEIENLEDYPIIVKTRTDYRFLDNCHIAPKNQIIEAKKAIWTDVFLKGDPRQEFPSESWSIEIKTAKFTVEAGMEEPLDLTKIWNAVKPQDVSKTYLPCKMIDDKEVMLAQGEESGGKADEIFMDMSLPKLSVNFNHSSNHQEDILASTNSHLAIIEQLQDQNKEMLKDIAEMKLVVTRIQEQLSSVKSLNNFVPLGIALASFAVGFLSFSLV